MYQLGSRIEAEPQFPVEISADMDVDGTDIYWQRILERLKGRTLITPARSVMEYAKQFQEEIRKEKGYCWGDDIYAHSRICGLPGFCVE